jgi:hypothetical protein
MNKPPNPQRGNKIDNPKSSYKFTMKTKYLTILISLLFFSCSFNQEQFNKQKWNLKDDIGYYSYREPMLDDLLENHKIKGLSVTELEKLLGEIKIDVSNKNEVYFNIVTDFGFDIDPVYTKDLILELDKNSIVKEYKIVEWSKD